MVFGESIPSPEHSPVEKLLQTVTSQAEALQNSEIEMNPLPLRIFIWWQSEDIHLLNKCSFCSMKSLYIQKPPFCYRVFFSNPQAQTQSKQSDKKIQNVSVRFIETCQTMFIFNPQVVF